MDEIKKYIKDKIKKNLKNEKFPFVIAVAFALTVIIAFPALECNEQIRSTLLTISLFLLLIEFALRDTLTNLFEDYVKEGKEEILFDKEISHYIVNFEKKTKCVWAINNILFWMAIAINLCSPQYLGIFIALDIAYFGGQVLYTLFSKKYKQEDKLIEKHVNYAKYKLKKLGIIQEIDK